VTHHVDDAVNLAERVMTLDGGRLALGERPWEEE
jgi:ABC-type proline/glycine betaine transport system ATPase subunit